MAAWKIERWSSLDIKVTEETLGLSFETQSIRDLVIEICAILDVALAELIAMRLLDDSAESSDFLGADEDGRAPAATFGARIQLAYLLGLFPKNAVRGLRAFKTIRNLMAHRVQPSLLSPAAQKPLDVLREILGGGLEMMKDQTTAAGLRELMIRSRTDAEAAKALILVNYRAIYDGLTDLLKSVVRVQALE